MSNHRPAFRFAKPLWPVAVAAVVLVTGAATAQQPADGIEAQMAALDNELAAHPVEQVVDIYKFLHQGCYGPGHAVPDRSAAEAYLTEEVDGLAPSDSSEPICQPLGGEPELVRIHLRPFVAIGAEPGALLDVFVASAQRVTGDPDGMVLALDKAVARLSRRGRWQMASQLEEMGLQLAAKGYPAVHHSESYVAAYHPAYRVVLRELAEQNGWCSPAP